jgi:hypothetical protein
MGPKASFAARRARSAQQIQAAWAHLGRARLAWAISLWATVTAAIVAIVTVAATRPDATGSMIRAAVGVLPILGCFIALLANACVLRWREQILALQEDRADWKLSTPGARRSRAWGV